MAVRTFDHAPTEDEQQECGLCGRDFCVADMALRTESPTGYLCLECDD